MGTKGIVGVIVKVGLGVGLGRSWVGLKLGFE
jgi:hypothetical protein